MVKFRARPWSSLMCIIAIQRPVSTVSHSCGFIPIHCESTCSLRLKITSASNLVGNWFFAEVSASIQCLEDLKSVALKRRQKMRFSPPHLASFFCRDNLCCIEKRRSDYLTLFHHHGIALFSPLSSQHHNWLSRLL